MPLLALSFISGAALALGAPTLPTTWALVALAVAALAAWLLRGGALAGVLAGFGAACLQGQLAIGDDWPCSRDREVLLLEGRVTSPAEARPGRLDFDFAPYRRWRRQGVPGLLRLTWYEPVVRPRPGETWRLKARLRCRSGYANPGGFERELDLLRRGYGATGYVVAAEEARLLHVSRWRAPVAAARAWIGEQIELSAGHTRSAAVLQGLSVGLRGSIDPAIRQAFINTGTAHLIAISGMHVTAFAVVGLWCTRRLYRVAGSPLLSRSWPRLQALTVCAITVAYGLLAGASLPTVRTVTMVALALCLRLARRHAPVADLLGASALLLTAADPLGVTSAGFWLSFAAVAALLGLVDLAAGGEGLLRGFVRAQAAVSVVLAPVLVGAFGGVPLVGPFVNALAIPLFSFILLPATLAGTALSPVAPDLAGRFWSVFGETLDRCWPALQWAAELPGSVHRPPAAPGWLLVAGVAMALAALVVPGRGTKVLAGALLVAVMWRPAPVPPQGGFELAMLDVGQGLAVVLRTATRVMVFDTGPRWRDGGSAAPVTLVPYLQQLGIGELDLVIVSHPDADHAGGLDVLAREFSPRWVIGDAGEAGGTDEPCTAGRKWQWDGVTFEVIHPAVGAAYGRNDASCALRVNGPGGAALLLADPEGPAERDMLARDLAADVVVVPHHGSDGSSSPSLIAAIGARWALVSAGFGNRWGLPRAGTVERWRRSGAELATTAEGGALVLRFVPGNTAMQLEAWRRGKPRWWRRQ